MKHTPGPWEAVCESDAQEWAINAPEGDERLGHARWSGLATVYGCDEVPGEGAMVARANAKLIAAAPKMYALLKRIDSTIYPQLSVRSVLSEIEE